MFEAIMHLSMLTVFFFFWGGGGAMQAMGGVLIKK